MRYVFEWFKRALLNADGVDHSLQFTSPARGRRGLAALQWHGKYL